MNRTYEKINELIVAELENGNVPWKKEWSTIASDASNYKTKHEYQGVNWLILNLGVNFQYPYYLSFKQARDLGGFVKKGSKGLPVVFVGKWTPKGDGASIDEESREVRFLKHYTVFNVSQIDGIEFNLPSLNRIDFSPIDAAESVVRETRLQLPIHHGRAGACYIPSEHAIEMPDPESFSSATAYYETLFHEMAHATKKPLGRKPSKDIQSYAREELVAEICSAYLCSRCGIDNINIENKAAYLRHWISHIKSDETLVVRACAQAQKAADYILEGVSIDSPDNEMAVVTKKAA